MAADAAQHGHLGASDQLGGASKRRRRRLALAQLEMVSKASGLVARIGGGRHELHVFKREAQSTFGLADRGGHQAPQRDGTAGTLRE
jgi:hypothetical protein